MEAAFDSAELVAGQQRSTLLQLTYRGWKAAPTDDFNNEMWGGNELEILKTYKLKARFRQETGL